MRAFLCVSLQLRRRNYSRMFVTLKCEERERQKRKRREGGRRGVDGGVDGGPACCSALHRDNRMPELPAYLCCTPRSCFCCPPLPAKSHPAATWGRRSAPPGPCSSSSGRGQITNTNHLLILAIKEILITSKFRSSASLNGHKETI